MAWKSDTAGQQILLVGNDAKDISPVPSAIMVVTAGVVHWMDAAPNDQQHEHTYTLEVGVYPISIKQLFLTDTTAVVLGLYD